VLGAGEGEHAARARLLEQLDQQRRLQLLRHGVHGVGDADRRRGRPLDLDRHRIVKDLLRERRDGAGHGRGEQEGLPPGRELLQDALDVRQEAHVQHAIGLVEHQHLEAVEPGVGHAHVVEQPAGRCDDDVHAAPEGRLLRAHAHAAEDGRAGQPRVAGELAAMLVDLGRELAGGGDDQGARDAAGEPDQPLQNRQQERRGLAAAGHGAGEHVAAGHGGGDGVTLDGGRGLEAQGRDATEQIGVEPEFGERHGASDLLRALPGPYSLPRMILTRPTMRKRTGNAVCDGAVATAYTRPGAAGKK
jgi:hypothetical protein